MTKLYESSNPIKAHFPQSTITAGPLQVITSSDGLFNHVDSGLPMWTGHGKRRVRVDILFEKPFKEKPAITLGVTGIDSAHDQNLRFWLQAKSISSTGFTMEFSTWADTHIARAAISWQAVGLGRTETDRAKRREEIANLQFGDD